MKKHFVEFYSPGSFVAEVTTKDIESWDINIALEMSKTIKERYNAKPYGFRFTTRERHENDFDSKQTAQSPIYYINCDVLTLEDIKNRNDPKDRVLISNMEGNEWDRVVQTKDGWKWTQPLEKDDIVLQTESGD